MRSQRANLLAAFISDLSMGSTQVQKNWLDTLEFLRSSIQEHFNNKHHNFFDWK